MPHLPYSIELHDSELSELKWDGESVHICLAPAYIHRDGKGWNQYVEIMIDEATVEGNDADLPSTLDDGYLHSELGPYHNLLNVPFEANGPVSLQLQLVSGEVLNIRGKRISHEFKGEPVFVEEFPST